jgi:hypothetical protein
MKLTGPVFALTDATLGALGGGADPMSALLANLPSLLDDSNRLYIALDLGGPLSFGFVGKGLGFGMFNRSYATVNVSSLLYSSFSVREEILLAGGYAYRFELPGKNAIDAGIMPKGFLRGEVSWTGTMLDLATSLSDMQAFMGTMPFTVTTGIGFDLGLRWSYDDLLAVGIACRDAYSPVSVSSYTNLNGFLGDSKASFVSKAPGLMPADLSVGFLYAPSFELLTRLGTDISFMVDYGDIFDLFAPIPRNPVLNLGIGTEFTMLEILTLRAGIKDALPAIGVTIDLAFMDVSFAMFGRELGLDPGMRPVYNLLLSLDFVY